MTTTDDGPCPKCGTTNPESRLGIQDSEVYDGTLFWACLICGHAWPREFDNPRRYAASKEAVKKWLGD